VWFYFTFVETQERESLRTQQKEKKGFIGFWVKLRKLIKKAI